MSPKPKQKVTRIQVNIGHDDLKKQLSYLLELKKTDNSDELEGILNLYEYLSDYINK